MEINTTRTINELITAISFALDIDEGEKLYHAWRVSIFASVLAKELLPSERKDIFYASLLHDIGAIGLPNHILHYLIREELPEDPAILAHPLTGAEITSQIPNLDSAAKFILNHHEWYNGKGYPLGRAQEEIPKASQIIGIADQIDILARRETVHIPQDIIELLEQRRNKQFSSLLVDSAVAMLKDEAFFRQAEDENEVEGLFQKIRVESGEIDIPKGVDAVGVACEVFSQLIDTKQPYMVGHSKRVSRYSLLIGLAMGLPHDELTKIKWGGLLHDIGKLGISRKLLDKPAKLTQDEYEAIKHHAVLTREILEKITDFREIALVVGSEHERYDGGGYPMGLKKEEIPLSARIVSVADTFDAITSNRTYRKGDSLDNACDEIKRNAGTQFDPAVVKEAIPILRKLTRTFA